LVGVVQALNQLFEKIMALDVDERHLLRMGHGEEELETEKDYSRSVCVVSQLSLSLCLTFISTTCDVPVISAAYGSQRRGARD